MFKYGIITITFTMQKSVSRKCASWRLEGGTREIESDLGFHKEGFMIVQGDIENGVAKIFHRSIWAPPCSQFSGNLSKLVAV